MAGMDQRTTGTGTGGSGDAVRRVLRDPQALIAIGLILVAVYALRNRLSTETLLSLVVVIPSIMLHEVAHGVVALACGADTAKRARRLTLNPIRHVDPMGTLILPILLAISGLGVFGYAKPVPINRGGCATRATTPSSSAWPGRPPTWPWLACRSS